MPKIPTFTSEARPTAQVGSVKSNLQIPLSQTVAKAGTSLLATTNFGKKKITDYFPKRDQGELVGNV